MTQYAIWSPPYRENSGGIRSLYLLCDALNRSGQRAFMTGPSRQKLTHIQAPWMLPESAIRLCRDGIAVYPESVRDNPFRANRIARWVLNKPGYCGGGYDVFPEEEKVFLYSDVFRSYVKNEIAGKLFLPLIDTSLFWTTERHRDRPLECYYVGKSQFQPGHFDPSDTFEITRQSPNRSELGKLLRRTRVLYTFDNTTLLTHEALLCGCAVVIIPDGSMTREDWAQHELGTAGIAWGTEEKERAIFEVDPEAVVYRHEMTVREFPEQLAKLISSV